MGRMETNKWPFCNKLHTHSYILSAPILWMFPELLVGLSIAILANPWTTLPTTITWSQAFHWSTPSIKNGVLFSFQLLLRLYNISFPFSPLNPSITSNFTDPFFSLIVITMKIWLFLNINCYSFHKTLPVYVFSSEMTVSSYDLLKLTGKLWDLKVHTKCLESCLTSDTSIHWNNDSCFPTGNYDLLSYKLIISDIISLMWSGNYIQLEN